MRIIVEVVRSIMGGLELQRCACVHRDTDALRKSCALGESYTPKHEEWEL